MPRMTTALSEHWPEYLMEAWGLGTFMVSAGLFGVLLFYPGSSVVMALPDPLIRRILMGLAMGATAVCIIYSPWGQQSGAHLNPAVTLTFLYLGKVAPWDAFFYIFAQFLGGITGVYSVITILGERFAAPPVSFVATMPGAGFKAAFVTEAVITFILMMTVLIATNTRRLARFTGFFAGCLVAAFITLVAPISGMSMNPARSFASAFPAGLWNGLWIYFIAPPLGMLTAATVFRLVRHGREVVCAKLNHHTTRRCIFLRCRYGDMMAGKE
ncbi:MAG TPA: aquaporin [Candidatus Methylomirabilis sp.]|nr:aquaporin [Candidatus Methylomirabilis sp.]